MAAFSGWRIDIFTATTVTDLTSYAQGFTTTAVVNIGRPSTFDAQITLDNDTGDFTPTEGGGTGTYAAIDWFTVGIRITQQTEPGQRFAFIGMISDFKIVDNGTNSSVQIRATDWLGVSSSQLFDVTESTTAVNAMTQIENILEGASGWGSGAILPDLGSPALPQTVLGFERTDDTTRQLGRAAATSVSSLDYINQNVLSGLPAIMIPYALTPDTDPPTELFYLFDFLYRTVTKQTSDRITFEFSESPTSTVLPFSQLEPGFDFDSLTSTSEINSGITGVATQTSTNSTTGGSYGTRARFYNYTGNLVETDSGTQAGALEAAQFWTSRQETARYVPRRLITSIELIEDRNSTAAATPTRDLLTTYGLWQPCDVTYTPTGGTQVTANCVIAGRTIQATPGRTTITLDLLPAQDYQSFVLDSDTLGVLNKNRLG